MSLLDNVLVLGENVVASDATVFNVIDTGLTGRNLSGNRHGAGYLNISVVEKVTSAEFSIYENDEPDAASGTKVEGTSISITDAEPGAFYTVKLPKKLKRYITIKGSITDTGKITAYIGAPIADH